MRGGLGVATILQNRKPSVVVAGQGSVPLPHDGPWIYTATPVSARRFRMGRLL